jgi:hypothetical protein
MAMSGLKDKLQEIVDFCQKQGYAGFVWNNGCQIDLGSEDEDEAEDLRYEIEDNFPTAQVYVKQQWELSEDDYNDLDEEIRDEYALVVHLRKED